MTETNGSSSAAVDFSSALERAKAIAAKLGAASAKAQAESEAQGTKRGHSDLDDLRPPSSGYRREDYDNNYSSERDSKRQATDDRYDSYGNQDSGRQRFGLGHSDAPTSHYGPSATGSGKTSEEISVPNQFVGLVIGRGGENMKRIERLCNVKVQFAPPNPNENERQTTITGAPEDVRQAKDMIMEQIQSGPAPRSGPPSSMSMSGPQDTVFVPAYKVGLIIGRGGETIHSLQDRSGARITVASEMQSDPSSNMRQITISGGQASIDMAKQLIDELINAPDARRPGGYGGYGAQGNTEVLKVHTERVGLVIGRGGEVVKGIQQACNVRIQIDQHPDQDGNRTVTISGPQENIDRAKEMVMDRVEGRRDSSGPPQFGGYGQQQAYGGYGGYAGYGDQSAAWNAQAGDPNAAAYAGYNQSAYAGWDQTQYPGYEQQAGQGYDQEAWNAYYQQYYQAYGYAAPGDGTAAPGADAGADAGAGAGAGAPGTSSAPAPVARDANATTGTAVAQTTGAGEGAVASGGALGSSEQAQAKVEESAVKKQESGEKKEEA